MSVTFKSFVKCSAQPFLRCSPGSSDCPAVKIHTRDFCLFSRCEMLNNSFLCIKIWFRWFWLVAEAAWYSISFVNSRSAAQMSHTHNYFLLTIIHFRRASLIFSCCPVKWCNFRRFHGTRHWNELIKIQETPLTFFRC